MRELLAGIIWGVAAAVSVAGSPASAVIVAYADCEKLPADVAAHSAYLWVGDLPEKEWPVSIQQLRYKLNTVSTEADIVQVYAVAPDLIRFDRRDPGPAFAIALEKTADVDPIFHIQVEVAEYEEIERKVTRANGYDWVRNDRGDDWVLANTVPKTVKKKTVKSKRGVMAAREIADCPNCRGWLPTQETAGLLLLTQSRSPILSGLWLWARLSRQLPLNNRNDGTGYYDFAGLTDRDALFKAIRFHEDDALFLGKILRAAVEAGDSGVAQNGRQIQWMHGPAGAVWLTLDTDHPDGDSNPIHNLKRGEFKPAAEEFYCELPNGLPVKFLCSFEDGKRQDSAPDFIGSNADAAYGGQDFRIHVQNACDDCHGAQVLRPIDDWVRKNFDSPQHLLQSPDYKIEHDFNREFFRSMEKQRAKDAADFITAMQDISGLEIGKLISRENRTWLYYANTPLDAEAVSRLMGCDEKTLVAALKAVNDRGGVDPVLFPLLRQGKINRRSVEEFSPVIHAILRDYTP